MQSTNTVSKAALWTGRVMSALPVLLILLGSVMKLMKHPSVLEGFARAGLSERLIVPVGLIELVCVVVYLVPQTSVLGAILMTGLLGWGGLCLRDVRLRALIPLRKESSGD